MKHTERSWKFGRNTNLLSKVPKQLPALRNSSATHIQLVVHSLTDAQYQMTKRSQCLTESTERSTTSRQANKLFRTNWSNILTIRVQMLISEMARTSNPLVTNLTQWVDFLWWRGKKKTETVETSQFLTYAVRTYVAYKKSHNTLRHQHVQAVLNHNSNHIPSPSTDGQRRTPRIPIYKTIHFQHTAQAFIVCENTHTSTSIWNVTTVQLSNAREKKRCGTHCRVQFTYARIVIGLKREYRYCSAYAVDIDDNQIVTTCNTMCNEV